MTPFGGPFDAAIITRRFQALLTREGVHPRAIQAALGWENLSMLNRYAHFVEEQRQGVASAMESILKPVAVNVAVKTAETKVS